jgi:SecD/SecF fusion protein
MRQIYKSAIIVLAVMIIMIYGLYPPEKKLRLGKDLSGGASLVYAVSIDPSENPKEVLDKTIEVLKRRVDPDGLLEITMVAVGNDRIEITMPLPSPRVKVLKQAFEDELAKLGRNRVSEASVDQAMRLPPAERSARFEELSDKDPATGKVGNPERLQLLTEAAQAFDAAVAMRTALMEATDPAVKDQLVPEVAEAESKYEEGRKKVVGTALSAEEVRRVVEASVRPRIIKDEARSVELPSPREVAEKQLYDAHPDAKPQIDQVLAKYNAYAAERTSLDDPADLMRMLRGAGVLSFRITVKPGTHPEEQRLREELRELGPRNVRAADARWFKVNQIDRWFNSKAQLDRLMEDPVASTPALFGGMGYVAEYKDGDYYMLCWDTRTSRLTPADGTWSVTSASQGADQVGRPAINFEMSPGGSVLLGNLTRGHVQDQMAVLLDDEVYTAPTLQSEISRSGQITGDFTPEEVDYIRRVLAGGSLQAKLSPEPLTVSSIGPELGADNLEKGLKAGLLSVIMIAGFMIVYYFGLGGVAVLSLVVNAACIMGAMALSKASFTMPGIAGIILTFGMAVDSNVLIYERMREELGRGADMKTAVRLGFDKALASIVDGNLTNLIVCIVLYNFGTPEIRGFAITLGIGVVATLFACLVFTRLVFNVLVAMGWRKTSMLSMAIPAIQRLLEPKIDWLRLRYVFFGISVLYMVLGLGLVIVRGEKMLDNEFRGGTQVTLQFQDPASGEPATMTRAEVEERVNQIGEQAPEGDELAQLRSAEVFPIDPLDDGVSSDQFMIKTVATNARAVTDAITTAFRDKLRTQEELGFEGVGAPDATAPIYAIEQAVLGANINLAGVQNDVSRYLGGVAIVLDNLRSSQSLDGPPTRPSLASLRERLSRTRSSQDYSDTLHRASDVFVLAGTDQSVESAAVVVYDDTASYFENQTRWETELRAREWQLVQDALTKPSTPAGFHNFSAAIAETFRKNAIIATLLSFVGIGVYIWIRFKHPRYALAAVVALVHDVVTVVGLFALCEVLYEHPATHGFASSIGLLPFKIDLNAVAALLTIAGYSLNDTVVVMDRIRENRGKLPYATGAVINDSVNQTFSRTLITGGTTLFACVILYLVGGEGVRAFAFALGTGLLVGTYSSVAVAAPLVWSRKHDHLPLPGPPRAGAGRELAAAAR